MRFSGVSEGNGWSVKAKRRGYFYLSIRQTLRSQWRIYGLLNGFITDCDNGLSPDRCQTVSWTNDGLLPIGIKTIKHSFQENTFQNIGYKTETLLYKIVNASTLYECVYMWKSFCILSNAHKYYSDKRIIVWCLHHISIRQTFVVNKLCWAFVCEGRSACV